MSKLNIRSYGSLLIVGDGSTLKSINRITGQIKDSKYSIHRWELTIVHTTREKNIIVGDFKGDKGVVILMNRNG